MEVSVLSEPLYTSQKAAFSAPALVLLSMFFINVWLHVLFQWVLPRDRTGSVGFPLSSIILRWSLQEEALSLKLLIGDDKSLYPSFSSVSSTQGGRKTRQILLRQIFHELRRQGFPPAFSYAGANAVQINPWALDHRPSSFPGSKRQHGTARRLS